ncbi:MAG: aminotransferase class I/II-fold pyridoxal phosphate-dependent enzyme, partial [Clostridia bacterium]|nr:aminotransferase class I/II-fold pyridoxal phosphate-dependent enzyme [Clostridia bacterium]
MKYDFETVRSRYNMGSGKWDQVAASGVAYGEDVVPFSVADMEFQTAPEIKEALKAFIDENVLGYANATDEFKQSVCNWMKRRHGWDAKPEWILPTHGVVEAFFATVQAFTKPGEGVMLMTPVYYPMYAAIKNNGRVLVDTKLIRKGSSYEIDFEDFEKKAKDENTRMLILCSPHNPCSRIWRREELEKIAKICNENNVLVIADEIHHDLVMPGYHHIVYATISEEAKNNCVVCTAPSKTFNLARLQTSSIMIPTPAIRDVLQQHLLRG